MEEQEAKSEAIMKAPTQTSILSSPDSKTPFVLQTDAGSYCLSAVSTQVIAGEESVIALASRTLLGT